MGSVGIAPAWPLHSALRLAPALPYGLLRRGFVSRPGAGDVARCEGVRTELHVPVLAHVQIGDVNHHAFLGLPRRLGYFFNALAFCQRGNIERGSRGNTHEVKLEQQLLFFPSIDVFLFAGRFRPGAHNALTSHPRPHVAQDAAPVFQIAYRKRAVRAVEGPDSMSLIMVVAQLCASSIDRAASVWAALR